jgi:nucleotide-binding universal stress UspA family protein
MIAIKKILVPIDFSECSDAALRYGRELAATFGAAVHLLHVIQNPYSQGWVTEGFAAPLGDVLTQWENQARDRMTESLHETERETVTVATRIGPAFLAIVDYAQQQEIDLIVIGTHGRGPLGHALLGSVAERVVRKAGCPVLTVHHPQHEFVAA